MVTIFTAYNDDGAEFSCDLDGFEYTWPGAPAPVGPPLVRKWTSRPAIYFAPGAESGVRMSIDDAIRNMVGA